MSYFCTSAIAVLRLLPEERRQCSLLLPHAASTLDTFTISVFKTTAKESKGCDFDGSCPIAAIAAGFGVDDKLLAVAIRDCFAAWEAAIGDAARARGMSEKNATVFASAFLASMEGAFVLS